MSLLEKADSGRTTQKAPVQTRAHTSLFVRAMAAASREEEETPALKSPVPVDRPTLSLAEMKDLESRLAALPPNHDSILSAWSLLSMRLPLAATALFLPQGDFLSLAARSGFPSGSSDAIPVSLAPSSQKKGELLSAEAMALVAPVLGVRLGTDLRATTMWSDVGLAGLWIYHDASLESSSPEIKSALASLFANAAAMLPATSLSLPVRDPLPPLIEKARKYRYASAFRFELSRSYTEGNAFRGLEANALRSTFLAACLRILAQGGTAFAYGEHSVACVFGSASPLDPELALFQFTKTLRRILPFLSGETFPEGFAMRFDPSSDRNPEELSRFLSA